MSYMISIYLLLYVGMPILKPESYQLRLVFFRFTCNFVNWWNIRFLKWILKAFIEERGIYLFDLPFILVHIEKWTGCCQGKFTHRYRLLVIIILYNVECLILNQILTVVSCVWITYWLIISLGQYCSSWHPEWGILPNQIPYSKLLRSLSFDFIIFQLMFRHFMVNTVGFRVL